MKYQLANMIYDDFAGKLFLILLLSLGTSCTELIQWDLDYQVADVLVVEAKITNEIGVHKVKISWPVYEVNTSPEPVSGADVEINDGRQIHKLTEDVSKPGTYLTDRGFSGEVNKGYQLRIRLGDKRVSALAFMRAVEPFPNMRLQKVQNDPPLYEAFISDQNGPSIIRMELDWSHVPGYDTLADGENHALIYHYTLGSVDVNRIFEPEREHVYFPPGTLIFREKESVSRAYEEFLRGMLSETDWRGGVFDVLPGNASSNFSEGAIGFFTAAEVIRDTVLIE